MTKVAIKNENITSFGGIYYIMDVFSKLGFEKPTEISILKFHPFADVYLTTRSAAGICPMCAASS